MSAAPSATRQNFSAEPHATGVDRREAFEEGRARRLVVRAAHRRDALAAGQARVRIATGSCGSPRRRNAQPFGAMARGAAPHQAERRRRDHADDRNAVAHQRDIDRVFVAARRGTRACRRADRPARNRAPGACAARPRPIPPTRPARREAPPRGPRRITASRGLVGRRDRRLVGLLARADVAAVEPQDRARRPRSRCR